MSSLTCRGPIFGAALLVALLSTSPARAQLKDLGSGPQPEGPINDVVVGVAYDRINQAKAVMRLRQAQARLRQDCDRANSAAVDRDRRRIENLRYRIAVDEWLIRQNSLRDPGCYPIKTDALTAAYIAGSTRPAPGPYFPQPRPDR